MPHRDRPSGRTRVTAEPSAAAPGRSCPFEGEQTSQGVGAWRHSQTASSWSRWGRSCSHSGSSKVFGCWRTRVISWVAAKRRTLADAGRDPAFAAEALTLPSESFLADQMAVVDVDAVHTARIGGACDRNFEAGDVLDRVLDLLFQEGRQRPVRKPDGAAHHVHSVAERESDRTACVNNR